MEKIATRTEALCFTVLRRLVLTWYWLTNTSPWTTGEEKWGNRISVVITVLLAWFLYFWSSYECAFNNTCWIANADMAKWLFGI